MGLGFPLPISHTVPVAVQMAEVCSEPAKIACCLLLQPGRSSIENATALFQVIPLPRHRP